MIDVGKPSLHLRRLYGVIREQLLMHTEQDLHIGDILGGFKIEKVLGRGGMGTVYMADDPVLNRKVALKVIAAGLSENEAFLMRFRREAQVIASLKHPHIVNILSYGQEKGHHFFAMEYVSGQDLRQVLQKRRSLPYEEALGIIGQVAEALSEAAAKGVVHRDIKPSNIMIDSTGKAYVTDFGVACFEQSSAKLTHTGMFVGTPEYASPEQAKGLALDVRSDIYSLGAVLYRMLSGQPPVSGESPLAVMVKICTEPVKPIAQIDPSIPKPLCALVDKMMAKALQQRYPSPGSLLEDINRCLRHLGGSDDPFASLTQAPLNLVGANAKGVSTKQHRTVRRNMIGVSSAAVFVVAVVLWIVWPIGKDSLSDVDGQHVAPQAHVEAPAASNSGSIDLDPNAELSTGSHEFATQAPALSASTPVQEQSAISPMMGEGPQTPDETELQKVAAIPPAAPETLPTAPSSEETATTAAPMIKTRRVDPKPAVLPKPAGSRQSEQPAVNPSERASLNRSTSSASEPSHHIEDHADPRRALIIPPPASDNVDQPKKVMLPADPVVMVVLICDDPEIRELIRFHWERRFRDSGLKIIYSKDSVVRDRKGAIHWSDFARDVTPGLAHVLILVDAYEPPDSSHVRISLRFRTQVGDIKDNKLISEFFEPADIQRFYNMSWQLKVLIEKATVDLESKIRKHWDAKRNVS
jgi:serine/threonine protein kinase